MIFYNVKKKYYFIKGKKINIIAGQKKLKKQLSIYHYIHNKQIRI